MGVEVKQTTVLMGRLPKGGDLLEELTRVCRDNSVAQGQVSAIGAVEKATLGYYHQGTREYEFLEIDENLEILSLMGNVSLRDGESMIHAHVTLGDKQGRAFGGHLTLGAPVFACEYAITVLEGARLERGFDEPTGLPLWNV